MGPRRKDQCEIPFACAVHSIFKIAKTSFGGESIIGQGIGRLKDEGKKRILNHPWDNPSATNKRQNIQEPRGYSHTELFHVILAS